MEGKEEKKRGWCVFFFFFRQKSGEEGKKKVKKERPLLPTCVASSERGGKGRERAKVLVPFLGSHPVWEKKKRKTNASLLVRPRAVLLEEGKGGRKKERKGRKRRVPTDYLASVRSERRSRRRKKREEKGGEQ